VEDLLENLRHAPAHRRVHHLLAVCAGKPVGGATLIVDDMRAESAALPFLFVTPDHRRRGVGSLLFEAARQRARAHDRGRLRTMTVASHAAATAFMERAGGRPGLVVEQSRCPTAELDVEQLQAWVDRAAERARGYSLVAFDGVCPEEHLEAFAAVIPIMNTAPHAEGAEDVVPSPDEVRESMRAHVRQGNESWTICAREDSGGRFVGYTELSLPRRRPWQVIQGDTGVHPGHRERGIGRWLKARNALRLLAEHPEVDYIETWNASANAAMLSINKAMGFRPIVSWQEWDLPTAQR
jgi:GNAT superfamily N-acetyltransferase